MKNSIKFPLVCFGLQLVIVVLVHKAFPKLYPGESFMIAILYGFNFVIGLLLFPIYDHYLGSRIKQERSLILANFSCVVLIINLVPLITSEHVFYTGSLLKLMFSDRRLHITAIIEFFNPIVSFIVASMISRKRKTNSPEELLRNID